MKFPGLRRLGIAAIPVALAASMLGLTTGRANALPKSCDAILDELYNDWAWADFYAQDALDANARGDWIGAAVYTDWSNRYESAGNVLYNVSNSMGC
jgi:hypothetical protein